MQAQSVSKDKFICQEGQALDAIHIIANGSVKAIFPGGEMILKKGDVIGLCDIAFDSHFFSYITLEDCSLVSFSIKGEGAMDEMIKGNPEVAKMIFTSMTNQVFMILSKYAKYREDCKVLFKKIFDSYGSYIDICNMNNVISRSLPQLDQAREYVAEEEVENWVVQYYATMKDLPQEIRMSLSARIPYLVGYIKRASLDIHSAFSACEAMSDYMTENMAIFMQESHLDMYDLFVTLLFRLQLGSPQAEQVVAILDDITAYLKESGVVRPELIDERAKEYQSKLKTMSQVTKTETGEVAPNAELANSIDLILQYADVDEDTANNFNKLIIQYKKLPDKASMDENAHKIRVELTKLFLQVYSEAFKMSIKDTNMPTVLKMFFNFGFVDEELAGIENANYLYKIADDFRGDPFNGVYTAYEWLKAIYNKSKDPSRNEFDVDYLSYLHDQKMQGKITPDMETKLANDPGQRVMFELENMFPNVNKMTYGRITSYCPVFSEHNVIKPLQSCLVNTETVTEAFMKVESIDYGAFYRETVYTNEACGIAKEYVPVRVQPDVILFPNIGTRGVMWQEIEGRKRTTPARFMVSVFHLEDIALTFTRLVGEFRWEMCKREQGARWNDVSEKSLTSEYFDYVQFYRKNSELSADAKEKIKLAMTKCKNSYKEMFVRDYVVWVYFEGTGSPRLNKVARNILAFYCPFPKELRSKIVANPLFKDIIERYEIKTAQKLHHIENIETKLKSSNQQIPKEIRIYKNYVAGTV